MLFLCFAAITALLCPPNLLLLPGALGQGPTNGVDSTAPGLQTAVAKYNQAMFQPPIQGDELSILQRFSGSTSGDVMRDKQFRKLAHHIITDCEFHYGHDMPLSEAIELVLSKSQAPFYIRSGRYAMISGKSGPYLRGRGFLWIDMMVGIGLGGFYFTPTNGEPTPSVVIFSKQVREQALGTSQLPPAFVEDFIAWSAQSGIPPLTTRYFITGDKKRMLLEHDQDYCASVNGSAPPPPNICLQMDADAADLDETAAYYLDQVHYATNATAWMIGPDQVGWLRTRDSTCLGVPDPLGCRTRITREHTHVIVHRTANPPHRQATR